jgi:cell division protein FtsQ
MAQRRRNTRSSYKPKRNRRKRNWLKLSLQLLVCVAVAGLVYLALTFPRLRISQIDVRGAKTIPVATVRACADKAIGENIFRVNTQNVRANILKKPVVKKAWVRRWPPNKLILTVEERVPYAAVNSGGETFLIDMEGMVFRSVQVLPKNLTAIDLIDSNALRVGVRADSRLIAPALDCLRQARENNFSVDKISVDPSGDMCLNMVSGLLVELGQPFDVKEKFAMLKKVLSAKPDFASRAQYLNLKTTSAPSWKPKEPSSTL